MAASTYERKRNILAVLERLGEAGPTAIGKEMGGEWTQRDRMPVLRQTLLSMVRANLLIRTDTPPGCYAVSPSCSRRGLDVRDATRKNIGRFLKACGGVARTGDIHDALTDRRLSGPGRGYDHHRITETLKSHFRQDFGRGYWNLPELEFEQAPLLGRWANYQQQIAWFEKADHSGFQSWEAKRDDFFDRVGSAFMDARGDRDIGDVATHGDIFYALRDMEACAPRARLRGLEALRAQISEEMAAEGVTDQWSIAQEVRNRKEDGLAVYLYQAFERGDPEVHMAAPIEFYRACAILFGVCPARLSRGEIVLLPAASG